MSASTRRPRLVLIEEALVDEARVELRSLVDEGVDLAGRLVALARRAQIQLAKGASPADVLNELEVLGLRHGIRMTATAAELRADELCPDGAEARRSGHGAAA